MDVGTCPNMLLEPPLRRNYAGECEERHRIQAGQQVQGCNQTFRHKQKRMPLEEKAFTSTPCLPPCAMCWIQSLVGLPGSQTNCYRLGPALKKLRLLPGTNQGAQVGEEKVQT